MCALVVLCRDVVELAGEAGEVTLAWRGRAELSTDGGRALVIEARFSAMLGVVV